MLLLPTGPRLAPFASLKGFAMSVKIDATTSSLLKSLALKPGTTYDGIVLTPLSFTSVEREWMENGVLRKASRPVFQFDSAIGPVSCYVLTGEGETSADALERTLNHLGLDHDPANWGPVTTKVTVSRHRNLIVETPRPTTVRENNKAVLAALGL